MYEVKVFDSEGKLKKVISKKDLAKRWDQLFKTSPLRKSKPGVKTANKKLRKVASGKKH